MFGTVLQSSCYLSTDFFRQTLSDIRGTCWMFQVVTWWWSQSETGTQALTLLLPFMLPNQHPSDKRVEQKRGRWLWRAGVKMEACFCRNLDCEQFEQPHCVVHVVAGGTVLAVLQSHGTSWGPDRPQWLPSFQRGHQTHVGGELELLFLPWYFPTIFWGEPSTVEGLLSLDGAPLDFLGWKAFVGVSCKLVLRTLSHVT